MAEVEHLLKSGCELGEGPLWDWRVGSLYWVDILGQRIHRWSPEESGYKTYRFDVPICALGLREKGGFIVATRDGFAFWEGMGETLQPSRQLSKPTPGSRLNDGAVDGAGRFWAGQMGSAPLHTLYRLESDLQVQPMEHGLTISNGIGWSPDQRRMYHTDSPLQQIFVYDFDPLSGGLAGRRVFVDVAADGGYPDGLAVDAAGYVWSARWGGGKITRFTPEGQVDRELMLPVPQPSSCAFGGANLDELYITSAWEHLDKAARAAYPLSGDVFRVKVGIRGQAAALFKG